MLWRRNADRQAVAATHEGAAVSKPAPKPRPPRKSWFQRRRERRKKRRLFEEIIAWIVVPALLYGVYLAYQAVGGMPPGALDFFSEVFSMVLRGGK